MTPLSRVVALVVSLSLAGSTFAAPAGTITLNPVVREHLTYFDLDSAEPVDVIVTLEAAPAGLSPKTARSTQLNRIRTERGNVFSHLRRNGIAVSPKHEFELAINGFSITVPANKLPVLAAIPGVTGIYENVPVSPENVTESAVPNASPELALSTPAIKADALWATGYRGNGILVAILDDGVDYTHPDLGGCLGAGCKVVAGFDFVDLDANPQSGHTTDATTKITTRDYHGTHVAATAAGLKGVAPDANILAVRVLGTNTSGKLSNLDSVMAGAEFAMRNGADVVNMSVGFKGVAGPSTNLYAQLTGNVMRSGVVWVNSNGNDGPTPYIPNMYGSSPDVIATGNADNRVTAAPRTTVSATNEVLIGGLFGTQFPQSMLGSAIEVVDVGFGNTPAAYAGKNVAGRIAIAMRGGATGEDAAFVNKGAQAKAAGAAGLIVYNDAARAVDFAIPALDVPSFAMSYANGRKVVANPLITVTTFNPGVQMNSSSSRGPTFDLLIKPDVSAPGTDIVAAVPFEYSATGYAALTGTSMAAPHVAGAAALLRQAHPEWTTQQVKQALMNTAANLTDLFGANYRAIDQGAGFVDLSRAVAPSVSIAPGSIAFGQLTAQTSNTATRSLTVNANGTYAVNVSFVRDYAGATVTTSTANVFSGTTAVDVTATIAPNSAAGEYEGYVNFVNVADPSDSYRVPFLFAHSIPVTGVKLSKYFVLSSPAAPSERIDVTFTAGRPLADWYFGHSGGTRFTANQGATAAGTKTFPWNVRLATGQTIAAGHLAVGIWYKLNASDTAFTFAATAQARLFIDKTAPLIVVETTLPSTTNQNVVKVQGAIADSGMFTLGEVGGTVLVNGQRADLFPRVPATAFASLGVNSELAFDIDVTLSEGQNSIVIYAEDAAGNRSTQTVTLSTSLDTIAPVTTATHTPAPNAAGWNNTAAALQLVATDGGSGVQDVRYSINGGTSTTVPGNAASIALSADGQYAVSYFATDKAGNAEAAQNAAVWIDATAPVVTIAGAGTFTVDQAVTVTCTATDNLSGVVGTPCAAPLVQKQAWELALGTTSVSATAVDAADNSATATATVTVRATFDSLATLTARFGANGNSLVAQLNAAKDAAARGNASACNNALHAYQNAVAAQSGKSLTAAQAAVLTNLANALKM
jgi:minor extracellular serine protease Vpr